MLVMMILLAAATDLLICFMPGEPAGPVTEQLQSRGLVPWGVARWSSLGKRVAATRLQEWAPCAGGVESTSLRFILKRHF